LREQKARASIPQRVESFSEAVVEGVAMPSEMQAWPQSWKDAYRFDRIEVYGDRVNLGHTYQYQNRLATAMALIRSVLRPGARILDVAAAQGNYSIALARAGYRVTWNDIREDLAGYVEMKADGLPIDYRPGNIFAMDLSGFDMILIGEVIEHVAHPDALLRHIVTLVRPGGYVLMTTPNGEYAGHNLPKFSECADPSKFEAMQFGPDSENHIFLLHEDELGWLTRNAGLHITTLRRINNPLTNGHGFLRHATPLVPRAVVMAIERATERLLPRALGSKLHSSYVVLLTRMP